MMSGIVTKENSQNTVCRMSSYVDNVRKNIAGQGRVEELASPPPTRQQVCWRDLDLIMTMISGSREVEGRDTFASSTPASTSHGAPGD